MIAPGMRVVSSIVPSAGPAVGAAWWLSRSISVRDRLDLVGDSDPLGVILCVRAGGVGVAGSKAARGSAKSTLEGG